MTALRILIVDDDIDFAESMAEAITNSGHHVELSHSGEDAVERFRNSDFDISFMDIKLPSMNGIQSFFEFRKLKPDAKVMMMTGYSVEQHLLKAVDSGAMYVLQKPFDIDEVLDALDEVSPWGPGL